jgi:hypothetical protein
VSSDLHVVMLWALFASIGPPQMEALPCPTVRPAPQSWLPPIFFERASGWLCFTARYEWFSPSFLCPSGHVATGGRMVQEPGSADLTAWVDFSALRQAVDDRKLSVCTHGPLPQGIFLLANGIEQRVDILLQVRFEHMPWPPWTLPLCWVTAGSSRERQSRGWGHDINCVVCIARIDR